MSSWSLDNDTRTLRSRRESDFDQIDRIQERPQVSSRSALVQTVTITTYPTVAGAFYGVTLVDGDGTENEGDSASISGNGDGNFTAFNLGTAIPPSGTYLIAHMVGGKWFFRYDSNPGTIYQCQLSSSLGPATGTWPSISPTSTTATVYELSGGSMTSLGSKTVYNATNTTFATGKTTTLAANGDGTFQAIEQDC